MWQEDSEGSARPRAAPSPPLLPRPRQPGSAQMPLQGRSAEKPSIPALRTQGQVSGVPVARPVTSHVLSLPLSG